MRVGIVGEPERSKVWEDLLVGSSLVSEVSFSQILAAQQDVDIIILLDDGDLRFETALEAIRRGCHVFIVSRLPLQRREAELLFHTSEEAGVVVQLAHWASFSAASQWMLNTVKKPDFIHVQREMSHSQFEASGHPFEHYLIEDLALILKWVDSNVHRIDANISKVQRHVLVRFDNGGTAVIYQQVTNSDPRHTRYASNTQHIVQCNVLEQSVRHGQAGPGGLFFDKRYFDHADAANMSVSLFLKAIQLKKAAAYTPYDAVKLVHALEMVQERLKLW